jgi:ribosomal protein S18 acetylase RimI-like enzyme
VPPTDIRRFRRLEGELRRQFEDIYYDSFPPEEREDPDDLARKIAQGEAILYLVREDSALVGFAYVLPLTVAGVYLIDYLAVARARRNRGIGQQLLERLRRTFGRCPRASGIMLEVESDDWGTDEERELRSRRIGFYRRNGAVLLPLPSHLRVPGTSRTEDLYSKLMWLPLGDPPPSGEKLGQCIRAFFAAAYGMPANDPYVVAALAVAQRQ